MTIRIPTANIEALEAKLAKIARKCEKLGCAFHYERKGECRCFVEQKGHTYEVAGIEVELEGTAEVNGWSFVAEIEHHETGNIVRSYEAIDEAWFTCEPKCDHCHHKVARNVTYIVKNESGEYKQVGSSCIELYTGGISAEHAGYLATVLRVADEYAKDDEFLMDDQGRDAYSLRLFATYAIKAVSENGYDRESFDKAFANTEEDDNRASEEQVDAFIDWALSYEPKNDYERNAVNTCKLGYVDYRRHSRIVASFIAKWVKSLSAGEKSVSQWAGNVGDKIAIRVTHPYKQVRVLYWKEFFVGRGWKSTPVFRIVADNGNVFKYAGDVDMGNWGDVGVHLDIVATIKSLEEYKGEKQTVIARPKVTESDE